MILFIFNPPPQKKNINVDIYLFLGHNLEEIRVRSLENLLSKLEHNLVCDSDLVNERHLMIRLIEWFNFPNPSKQGDVLHLLLRLSKVNKEYTIYLYSINY